MNTRLARPLDRIGGPQIRILSSYSDPFLYIIDRHSPAESSGHRLFAFVKLQGMHEALH